MLYLIKDFLEALIDQTERGGVIPVYAVSVHLSYCKEEVKKKKRKEKNRKKSN